VTGEELLRARLDTGLVADCLSDDPEKARRAMSRYLSHVFSFVASSVDLPSESFDPFHRLTTALGDTNRRAIVSLFEPPLGSRRAAAHMNVVYAAAAAMVTILNRDHGQDLTKAAKQAVRFIVDLGFAPPPARSDADDSRTDAERLLAIRKKCSSKSATRDQDAKTEYQLMCDVSLDIVEGRLRQLHRWQP